MIMGFCVAPFWLLQLCVLILTSQAGILRPYGVLDSSRFNTVGDAGDPLFLTPLLMSNKTAEAREASKVNGIGPNLSYSGFLTTNETTGNNLFFWFFPAMNGNIKAPILMWLQGGPGASSMSGLFDEIGPISVTEDGSVVARNITWNRNYSLVFFDNPVGTGFSFTKSDAGYAKDEYDVARDLYSAVYQFFEIFSDYQDSDFYVAGESYGCKYIPAIAYKIHVENPLAKMKINLKGVSIGDGWCDPDNMVGVYADFMLQTSLLDIEQAREFAQIALIGRAKIAERDYVTAFKVFDILINGDLTPYPTLFNNATGCTDYLNYLRTVSPSNFGYFSKLLSQAEARKAIHVGNLTFNNGQETEKHLLADVMRTYPEFLLPVFDNYKTLVYSGQVDVIVAPPLTYNFLNNLDWKGRSSFQTAKRKVWKVKSTDVDVAGFVKSVTNIKGLATFHWIVVRDAGHILPYDQPERGLDMITRFIEDEPF
ncbi:probable serine carboxypeptidase CPVL [Corticium candelabrum]|uniref:probable serine carboxypeptidase CPVL n=1 Tax=Corticium candelabrum TaxID=121492 RepID=UPI002E26D1AC|nr:probable serine carboxypeptidase CPVL [Corticium candelabrum]